MNERAKEYRRDVAFAVLLASVMSLGACGKDLVPRGRVAAASNRAPVARAPSQPTMETRQCLARLQSQSVRFTPLPNRTFGGGCSAIGSVKLLDIGVPTTNLGGNDMQSRGQFRRLGTVWRTARRAPDPGARRSRGSRHSAPIIAARSRAAESCPNTRTAMRSTSARFSCRMADASPFRKIGTATGVRGNSSKRCGASACKRFRTVLSPDYNAAHHDHFHFDMGGRGGFCRLSGLGRVIFGS